MKRKNLAANLPAGKDFALARVADCKSATLPYIFILFSPPKVPAGL